MSIRFRISGTETSHEILIQVDEKKNTAINEMFERLIFSFLPIVTNAISLL
jgi:hypothetical protein